MRRAGSTGRENCTPPRSAYQRASRGRSQKRSTNQTVPRIWRKSRKYRRRKAGRVVLRGCVLPRMPLAPDMQRECVGTSLTCRRLVRHPGDLPPGCRTPRRRCHAWAIARPAGRSWGTPAGVCRGAMSRRRGEESEDSWDCVTRCPAGRCRPANECFAGENAIFLARAQNGRTIDIAGKVYSQMRVRGHGWRRWGRDTSDRFQEKGDRGQGTDYRAEGAALRRNSGSTTLRPFGGAQGLRRSPGSTTLRQAQGYRQGRRVRVCCRCAARPVDRSPHGPRERFVGRLGRGARGEIRRPNWVRSKESVRAAVGRAR